MTIPVDMLYCSVGGVTVSSVSDISYQIKGNALLIPFGDFDAANNDFCGFTWEYKVVRSNGSLLSGVSIASGSQLINVYIDIGNPGEFSMKLVGTLSNGGTTVGESTFKLTIEPEPNEPPYLTSEPANIELTTSSPVRLY